MFVGGATAPALAQTSDYYPFGQTFAPMTTPNNNNKYLYNGKELQTETLGGSALNMLDYGLRYYDPATARFTTQDPLAESYYSWSPYNYVGGNPIKRTDTDGAYWDLVIEAASISAGVTSMINNIQQGNGWAAVADGVGVAVDAALVIVPCVPGGAGLGIQATRAGDKAIDAVQAVDAATDITKAADTVTDAAQAIDKGSDAMKAMDKGSDAMKAIGPAGDAGGSVMKQLPDNMQSNMKTTNN